MRNGRNNNKGFSLAEVLLAVCTLAVGMIFVAGVFPAGVLFTTIATERTIAAVVADEAFAKIRLIAGDPAFPIGADVFEFRRLKDFEREVGFIKPIDADEFAYPSTDEVREKRYRWSALCRRIGLSDVQVTVFVCRKIGTGKTYRNPTNPLNDNSPVSEPMPVEVGVSSSGTRGLKTLIARESILINDGYIIVDNETGRIFRVLERSRADDTLILDLDQDWGPDNIPPDKVWVIPPPSDSGRSPCIAVYQRVIEF